MNIVHGRVTAATIATATAIAGTLDILSACVYAAIGGRTPLQMLQGVAGAILPEASKLGLVCGFVGLVLHFAIMAVMATVYVLAARRLPDLRVRPLVGGLLYGIATWAVMNLVVLPLRWPGLFPKFGTLPLFEQLFSHIVLVGVPIAFITGRHLKASDRR